MKLYCLNRLFFAAAVAATGLPDAGAQTLFAPGGTVGTSVNGHVGIGTSSPAAKLTVQALHGDTQLRLFSDNYGQGVNGVNTALLNLWASEPGWSWDGVGIGNNVQITNGASRITTTRGGSYIRLLSNGIYLNTIDGQGVDRFGLAVNGGNVGIGTAGPSGKLQVEGGRVYASQTSFANPSAYANADLVLGSNADTRNGYGGTNGSHIMLRSSDKSTITVLDENQNIGQISYQNLKWTIGENVGWGEQIVYMLGNVGIGTTNPTQKLSVNGTVRAKEVIVEASPWPDDVFAPGYALPSVDEVAAHIATAGHLPGVPSAATVADQGIAVGEMQAMLLRKVEELTLYVIDLKQENASLRARVEQLERHD